MELTQEGSRDHISPSSYSPQSTLQLSLTMAKLQTIVVGRLQTSCYILQSDSTGLVVDPSDEPERILRILKDIAVYTTHIIATHNRLNHERAVHSDSATL